MRVFLTIYLISQIIWTCFSPAYAAPRPAADVAPNIKKERPKKPAEQLIADFKPESIKLPEKPWKIPEATLDLRGHGIALYYLIPYKRVQSILPTHLQPYPGREDIWFRVDIIQWTIIRSKLHPIKKMKPFVELSYRFEVLHNGQRATYVLQNYSDTGWPVLWGRQHGEYNIFPANRADVNFSPFIHFFQMSRMKKSLITVQADPLEGMGAQMQDLFGRKGSTELWNGSRYDITAWYSDDTLAVVSRNFDTEIKNAKLRSILLTEPVQWKIISEDEVMQPTKVLIMESINGTWNEKTVPNEKKR